MADRETTTVRELLTSVMCSETVEREAQRLGVVKRKRRVDVFALVWTLVLSFQDGAARTIASLRQAYGLRTGVNLVASAFYTRLSAPMAKLLRKLALDALSSLDVGLRLPSGALSGFRDLLAIDATVLRLHKLLGGRYGACRTNHTEAAAKLHMVMSVVSGSPHAVKVTAERVNDRTPWRRVGQWVKDCLLLFDLGYYCYHLFDRIDANGGFFLSRAKSNANPLIVAINRKWRGRSVDVVGKRLREVLPFLRRGVLDVMVQVSFDRRAYRGKSSRCRRTFRLVAILNATTGEYHCYFTNIGVDQLAAEEIRSTYALRWQVELLFKAMKTHGHLAHLPSSKEQVVQCLIWASVLATIVSQVLYRVVRPRVAPDRYMPLLRWAALFARQASELLRLLVVDGSDDGSMVLATLVHEAPDPNVTRRTRAMTVVPELIDG